MQLILYIFKRLYLLFECRFISAKKCYKKAKSSIYATIKKMEVFKLGKKFKITMDMAMQLENYEYNEMIRLAAVLKILQDDGVTPEVLEHWGFKRDGEWYLRIPLSDVKEGVDGSDFFFEQNIHDVVFKVS